MKSKIFMYLFIFALMYAIFQYANSKRYFEAKQKELTAMAQKIDTLEAQLENTISKGFTLKTNRDAREYFEDMGLNVDSVAAKIKAKIIAQNSPEQDNPLVPYAGSYGPMQINNIIILNKRWVMVKFTDGKQWGEALISYYLDNKNAVQFDLLDGVLYSN